MHPQKMELQQIQNFQICLWSEIQNECWQSNLKQMQVDKLITIYFWKKSNSRCFKMVTQSCLFVHHYIHKYKNMCNCVGGDFSRKKQQFMCGGKFPLLNNPCYLCRRMAWSLLRLRCRQTVLPMEGFLVFHNNNISLCWPSSILQVHG